MFTPKERKESGDSPLSTPSLTQSESTHVKESRFEQLEKATKDLSRSSISNEERTVSNAIASIQFGSIGTLVPQDHQSSATPASVDLSVKDLPLLPKVAPQHAIAPSASDTDSKDLTHSASIVLQLLPTPTITEFKAEVPALSAIASGDKTSIFPQNVAAPSLRVSLPAPGSRLETTMQLAYCNQLLRTHVSPSSATASITVGQDLFQQASVDALPHNIELSAYISSNTSESVESFVDHPLNQWSIVSEPSIMQFLAERVKLELPFKSRLLAVIEDSKVDARVSQAAANAISILVRAGVRFNGADLCGIKIPGADLHGGQFDLADMQGADLSDVNLTKTWLRQANLSETKMTGAQFGELPYLEIGEDVMACIFSPDGDLLALSTESRKIIVYETATWTKINGYSGGYAIAISPTTRELAKHHKTNVKIGDILTGKVRLVLSGHSDSVNHISYSPDGEMIATSAIDKSIRIWSTSSGSTLHVLRGHTDSVHGVAFSPTGLHIVSCSTDKTVRTWDAQSGELLHVLEGHTGPIYSVAYSPDGRQIASAESEGRLLLWDAHTGSYIRDLFGHLSTVNGVVYSPIGDKLASCDRDGAVRIWDPLNGELFCTLSGHSYNVSSVSYSSSGKHIASGSYDGTVRLWDVGRALPREEPKDSSNGLLCVDMSPDGAWTATGNVDATVQLWETRTGMPGAILTGHGGHINSVAFSPCGKQVAAGDRDGSVSLWCAHTGESVHVLQGHTAAVYSVVFSPNGHQLASGGGKDDRTVRLWNSKTGEPGLILEGHTAEIRGLSFSPSGQQVASCSDDTTVRIWCSLTGEQLMILHHEEVVDQVRFSPNGLEVISFSWLEGELGFWDLQSGEKIDQPTLKGCNIVCCSYSPCGKLLTTGDRDGVLRLWDRNSEGGDWSEVYRSAVGAFTDIRWRQGLDGMMYLTTLDTGSVRMWEGMEVEGSYILRLLWSLGKNELSLVDADLSGAVGLSPVDLKMVKQRGAVTESASDSE